MSEMIDRVAKAIYDRDDRVGFWSEWEDLEKDDPTRKRFLLTAHVVIEAMREPTDEMFTIGSNRLDDDGNYDAEDVWFGMIDAALK